MSPRPLPYQPPSTGGPSGNIPAPTRHQLLDVAGSMQDFSRSLRGLAVMVEGAGKATTGDAELVAALRVVANSLDNAAIKLSNDDPDRALDPGDTTLAEAAALMLATLWDCGQEGFKSSVSRVASAFSMEEGKS